MEDHQLYLCLGGNIGKKSQIFQKSLFFIENRIGRIEQSSPLFISPPWGFVAKEEFWNQVIVVVTMLTPPEVLREIRKIESYFGRNRESGRYLSRRMDIDILFYDQLILKTEELTIPHPLMEHRKFVLMPLAHISPGFLHPVTGKSVAQMVTDCDDPSEVRELGLP